VPLDPADHASVVTFCRREKVDLVVVGPEAPLVAGLVDALDAAGIRAFGPTKAAAQLEGSKGFTKDLCREAGIPTAGYRRFTDLREARSYVDAQPLPVVG
jgi:phosphoribosylamine--glycine ligase